MKKRGKIYLNGKTIGNYLSITNSEDWEFKKGDFTIDFFIEWPYELVWWTVNDFMYNRFLKRS